MKDSVLTSIVHPDVSEFLSSKENVFQTIETFGSPVHIIFPHIFLQNIQKFRQAIEERLSTKYQIKFAVKATKASSFLEAATLSGIGLDVSSVEELRSGLCHGTQGDNIIVNGSAKTQQLLHLALCHQSLIAVDSPHELKTIENIQTTIRRDGIGRVILRANKGLDGSRFGIDVQEYDQALSQLQQSDSLKLEGISQHCGCIALEERVLAIRQLLDLALRIKDRGAEKIAVDIGGGFPVNYVTLETWQRFSTVADTKSFGGLIPYVGDKTQEGFLAAVLDSKTSSHSPETISDFLLKNDMPLIIEPGRSLLDQSGVTLMKILGKKSLCDDQLLDVEGNMHALSGFMVRGGNMPDPLLISERSNSENSLDAKVVGNTCYEKDMPSSRYLTFQHKPECGDVLAYINTAGYTSSAAAVQFHRQKSPPIITAIKRVDGSWKLKPDENCIITDISHLTQN